MHTTSRSRYDTVLHRFLLSLTLAQQYCEFGGTTKKCEEWLADAHPALHAKLYSQGTLRPLVLAPPP